MTNQPQVALVTGGGTGIGLMATQALAVNGAKVYITGREKAKLDRVVETHGQNIAGEIIGITCDVTSKTSISSLVEEISRREKCLCILINNAGVNAHTQQTEAETAEEMSKNLFDDPKATFDDWIDSYRTNVPSIFFLTTPFLPLLAKATELHKGYSGTVVNIASISGMAKTAQHHFAYNASKGAAIHLSKLLAAEVTGNGIKVRINTISPGVFPSEMTTEGSGEDQKSFIPKENFENKVPARRPGNDRDMAGAVLFAVTNQYLNGQNVAVDGGYLLSAGT